MRTKPASDPVRATVRRELELRSDGPPISRRGRGRRACGQLLRVTALVAVLSGLGGALSAQAPYRQELIPGFSSLDVSAEANPAFVDFDGDGDLDAVIGEQDGDLNYFANTGSSAAPVFVEATGSANPFAGINVGFESAPEVVDLDGDGDLDAVVGEYLGNVNFFENTGSSTDPAFVQMLGGGNPFDAIDIGNRSSPELVDLDADGDLDAVVGETIGTLNYFENTGSSSSPVFVAVTGTADPFSGFDIAARSGPELVDLDADGDLDAVVGASDGLLSFFENTGSSAAPDFVPRTGTANPFTGIDLGYYSSPELVDLDADGDLDAAVGEIGGTLRFVANSGGSAAPAFVDVTGSASPFSGVDVGARSAPELADLDGDGDLEAVLGSNTGALRTFTNTGSAASPAFSEATGSANPFVGIDVGSASSPDLADLDADGDLDAAVGGSAGTLSYFANTGSSLAPAFVALTGSADPFAGIDVGSNSSPTLVDLDGDGDLDGVVGENGGGLRYFANTGSSVAPTFVEATGTANPFTGIDVTFDSLQELADLDADGDLDVLVGEIYGVLSYFVNTGTSTLAAFAAATGSANPFDGVDVGGWSSPALFDLDGDGDLDALVGEDNGRVVFFRSRRNVFSDDFESGGLTAWSNF